MARILVTGATGFIGRHIVQAVLEGGDEARCLVRNPVTAAGLQREGVALVSGDMTDPASLQRALQGVDGVIHSAAMLKTPWRRDYVDANVGGAHHMAVACRERGTPLVLVSSLAAAGPAPDSRARIETDVPQPVSLYGRIKLQAEQAALTHADAVPLTIVRPPMVFGERDRSALTLFRMAWRGVQPLPGGADRPLSLIHAVDLAALLHAALRRGERAGRALGQGVYYACADESLTVSGLGAAIAGVLQRPPPRPLRVPLALLYAACVAGEFRGRLADAPQLMNLDKYCELSRGPWWCSADKAQRDLGFRPQSLQIRLQQTVQWYRQQGWLEAA